MQEAITKIQAEMAANDKNPYIRVIGEFLIGHLGNNPEAAEKILADDKTVAKSLDAMKAEAKKKQHNGVAMLTDAEGFAIVLKYFEIDGGPVVSPASPAAVLTAAPAPPPAPTPEAEKSSFDYSFEDFLR